jgi:SAM-dependent methyltransferase
LAYVLNQLRPNWRNLAIHESSPANRGISAKLKRDCKGYIATHYFPNAKPGSIVRGFRNENIEKSTFSDGVFDVVITLDILEHVFNPRALFKDIFRTLKQGGLYISTFPIKKDQVKSHVPRVRITETGEIEELVPAEYHGNPINGKGALVTFDYGYTVHQMIPQWAPFEVEITRFCNRHLGILGEYTEVATCYKPK